MKQATFHRLANTAPRDILCEKIAKSVAGDRVQTVQFAVADFNKSRLLCKDTRYDSTQRVLRGLAVSFRRYRQKELCLSIFISNGYPRLKECRDDSCKSKGTRWDDTCKSKIRPSEPRPTLKCQVSLHQQIKSRALPELVVCFEGSARAIFNYRGLCPN